MNRSKFLKGLVLAAGTLLAQQSGAQAPTGYYTDAAKFAQHYIGGSARFQGFAGAGSALGGDLTSTALNPAGLGVYRKSDLGITTNLAFLSSNSTYLNEANRDSRAYLNFPNFGVAFCNAKDDLEEGQFRGGTFAITYNKINNFNSQVFYSGINNSNSITQSFVELVNRNGVPDYAFEGNSTEIFDLESLIYLSYLTEVDGFGKFYNPIDSSFSYEDSAYYNQNIRSYPAYQEQTITTKGGQNQFDFAYGGNFSDKFYVGGGMGIVRHRYMVTKDFYEQAEDSSGLVDLLFNQTYRTTGYGVNGKIGIIFRPKDAIRFSLNLQTPTFYSLTENYQYSIVPTFNTNYYISPGNDKIYPADFNLSLKTESNEFKYKLTTPAIIRAGGAYIIGKAGFITADVEYVPYKGVRLRNSDSPRMFNGDNKIIRNDFSNVVNVKAGAELRAGIYRVRGGYAYNGDPMRDLDDIDRTVHTVTLGAGIKLPEFYFDFAIVNSRSNAFDSPYTLENRQQPGAKIRNIDTGIMFSVGTSF
jgi:hypothetical protein